MEAATGNERRPAVDRRYYGTCSCSVNDDRRRRRPIKLDTGTSCNSQCAVWVLEPLLLPSFLTHKAVFSLNRQHVAPLSFVRPLFRRCIYYTDAGWVKTTCVTEFEAATEEPFCGANEDMFHCLQALIASVTARLSAADERSYGWLVRPPAAV